MSILRIYHAVYQTRGSLRGNVLTTLEARLLKNENGKIKMEKENYGYQWTFSAEYLKTHFENGAFICLGQYSG
ncbi:unnamed protein product [Nesidiocoris tenuis]|uniref:Uncharacterized protein n=1 Tax=Nesidiocoris tenuis TaxID=355587 RepID=A0A6H5H0N6_9HEMI|nr:unnamed protein product [Nesidiocoris tenuis]